MKRIVTFTIILMALTACTSFRVQTSDSAGTEIPEANMPNPASVYCEKNGNTLEIHTAADGSQSGVCVFPDGNTLVNTSHKIRSIDSGSRTAQLRPKRFSIYFVLKSRLVSSYISLRLIYSCMRKSIPSR